MTEVSPSSRSGVLFVAPQVPFPLDTGGKIRTYYQLMALAKAYPGAVDMLALGPGIGEHGSDPLWRALRERLRGVHCVPRDGISRAGTMMAAARSLLGGLPYPVEKYQSEEAAEWIRARTAAGHYRAIHFDSLHTFRFVDAVQGPVRFVLDEHNVEALILERMAQVETSTARRLLIEDQARRTDRFERSCALQAHRVLLCSDDDRRLLAGRTGRDGGLVVIPNGVDLGRFEAEGEAIESPNPYVLFLGSMDWWPNSDGVSWFVESCWPRVRQQAPELTLKVVGRNPTAQILALDGHNGVEIVGGVPDVRPYMRGCSAFAVPLRVGGGTRLKILEALSIGAPIVSTSLGCEGIEVVDGEHLRVADEPDALADAVVEVAADKVQGERLARAGRRLVEERYG